MDDQKKENLKEEDDLDESRQGRGSPKAADESETDVERSDKERGNAETDNTETQNGNAEIQKEEGDTEEESKEESPKFFHSSGSSQIYAGPKGSGKKIPILLGILVIILILGGSFYFLRIRPGTREQPLPSPVTFEESTPEPSPTPGFDRSSHTLRVLNGTKTQGLAASTSAKLKDLGYEIEKTGNATNSAFLKTVVRVKPDLEELLENLLKDLGSLDFEGEEGPELKDSDSSDGEVILGAE